MKEGRYDGKGNPQKGNGQDREDSLLREPTDCIMNATDLYAAFSRTPCHAHGEDGGCLQGHREECTDGWKGRSMEGTRSVRTQGPMGALGEQKRITGKKENEKNEQPT